MDDSLTGTWFVVRTSLPFWRTRTAPAVTYAPLPDGRLADLVTYRRRGRARTVAGIDTPLGDGRFRWRGLQPATLLTTSEWQVLDSGNDWAVTQFAKTLFTPEGIDVYWRTPEPDDGDVDRVVTGIRSRASAERFVDQLFTPDR